MFRTRLLSGIVLVVLAFVSIWCGGPVLAAVLCAISMIAYRELTKATGVHTQGKKINGLEIAGFTLVALYYIGLCRIMMLMQEKHLLNEVSYYNIDNNDESLIYGVLAFGIVMSFIVFMMVYVFSFPKFKAGQVMACFFEFIYAPVLLSFLLFIRVGWQYGIYLVWFVFL